MFNGAFEGRRVLVVGHTGFKGSWLTCWLRRLGAEVAGFANGVPTDPAFFEVLGLAEGIEDHRGDIRDLDRLRAVFDSFQPEVVIHLAAKAIVRECYDDPLDAFSTNVMGSLNVLEAIRRTDSVRAAVMITSDKCYENVEWEYGYRETDRLGGKDPYSASKACAEIAFSSYARSYLNDIERLAIATTRAGNVIGGGDWARDRIVPDCIRAWSEGEEVTIRSPRATRPWQHVLEPLSGYLALASRLLERDRGLDGEPFNFGPDAEVNKTVEELIAELQKIWTGSEYRIDPAASQGKKEASLLKLCCDKALFRLDWQPTLRFEDTVSFTAGWYKQFYDEPGGIEGYTLEQIERYQTLAKEKGLRWAR